MRTLHYFKSLMTGLIIFSLCCNSLACTITYEWKNHLFAGATALLATYNTGTGKYHAQESYTLKGIWKNAKIIKMDPSIKNIRLFRFNFC